MMSVTYKAVWSTPGGTTEERAIADVEEIVRLVQQLQADAAIPTMLLIWEPGQGRELGVGLGRDQTVFTYQASLDPPYFISAGGQEGEGVWFAYGGEQTEYMRRNLVDTELIAPTIRRFITSTEIPDTLNWERL